MTEMNLRKSSQRRVPGRYREDFDCGDPGRPSFVHADVEFNEGLARHCAFPSLPLDYPGEGPSRARLEREIAERSQPRQRSTSLSSSSLDGYESASQQQASEERRAACVSLPPQQSQRAASEPELEYMSATDWGSDSGDESAEPGNKGETPLLQGLAAKVVDFDWNSLHEGVRLAIMRELNYDHSFTRSAKLLSLTFAEIHDFLQLYRNNLTNQKIYTNVMVDFIKARNRIFLDGKNPEEEGMTLEALMSIKKPPIATNKLTREAISQGQDFLRYMGLPQYADKLEKWIGEDSEFAGIFLDHFDCDGIDGLIPYFCVLTKERLPRLEICSLCDKRTCPTCGQRVSVLVTLGPLHGFHGSARPREDSAEIDPWEEDEVFCPTCQQMVQDLEVVKCPECRQGNICNSCSRKTCRTCGSGQPWQNVQNVQNDDSPKDIEEGGAEERGLGPRVAGPGAETRAEPPEAAHEVVHHGTGDDGAAVDVIYVPARDQSRPNKERRREREAAEKTINSFPDQLSLDPKSQQKQNKPRPGSAVEAAAATSSAPTQSSTNEPIDELLDQHITAINQIPESRLGPLDQRFQGKSRRLQNSKAAQLLRDPQTAHILQAAQHAPTVQARRAAQSQWDEIMDVFDQEIKVPEDDGDGEWKPPGRSRARRPRVSIKAAASTSGGKKLPDERNEQADQVTKQQAEKSPMTGTKKGKAQAEVKVNTPSTSPAGAAGPASAKASKTGSSGRATPKPKTSGTKRKASGAQEEQDDEPKPAEPKTSGTKRKANNTQEQDDDQKPAKPKTSGTKRKANDTQEQDDEQNPAKKRRAAPKKTLADLAADIAAPGVPATTQEEQDDKQKQVKRRPPKKTLADLAADLAAPGVPATTLSKPTTTAMPGLPGAPGGPAIVPNQPTRAITLRYPGVLGLPATIPSTPATAVMPGLPDAPSIPGSEPVKRKRGRPRKIQPADVLPSQTKSLDTKNETPNAAPSPNLSPGNLEESKILPKTAAAPTQAILSQAGPAQVDDLQLIPKMTAYVKQLATQVGTSQPTTSTATYRPAAVPQLGHTGSGPATQAGTPQPNTSASTYQPGAVPPLGTPGNFPVARRHLPLATKSHPLVITKEMAERMIKASSPRAILEASTFKQKKPPSSLKPEDSGHNHEG